MSADDAVVRAARQVHERPGMHVAQSLFPSVCAYLSGFEWGAGSNLISEFRHWLVRRVGVPDNWTIEDAIMHSMARPPGSWAHLTSAENLEANAAFFAHFEEFVAAGAPAPPPAAVDPP